MVLSQRNNGRMGQVTGNQLLDELKNELEDGLSTESTVRKEQSVTLSDYLLYWTYLLFVATIPLLYLYMGTLVQSYLVLPLTLLISGIVSNLITVWRIDRRVSSSTHGGIDNRMDSAIFTFFQISIVQGLFILFVLSSLYFVEDYILFTIFGREIELYIILTLTVGGYLYVFKLNSLSFNWYLTGQPFWIPIKEILVIPLSSVKKRLAVFRLLLWTLSLATAYIQIQVPDTYPYLSLFLALTYLIFGRHYIREDLRFTMRMSLTVTTRINQNLPKPVVSPEEDYDPALAKNLLTKSSSNIQFADPENQIVRKSNNGYRTPRKEVLDEKARESFNKLVQTVISQREEINKLYRNTNSRYSAD